MLISITSISLQNCRLPYKTGNDGEVMTSWCGEVTLWFTQSVFDFTNTNTDSRIPDSRI